MDTGSFNSLLFWMLLNLKDFLHLFVAQSELCVKLEEKKNRKGDEEDEEMFSNVLSSSFHLVKAKAQKLNYTMFIPITENRTGHCNRKQEHLL